MATQLRSIRLAGKTSTALNRVSGDSGEVFYDSTSNTLRVFTGRTVGGDTLVTSATLSAAISTAIDAIPPVDLSSYATANYVTTRGYITSSALASYASQSFVTESIASLSIPSIAGLASESFVTNAIAGIETGGQVDLTGYATEGYVTTALGLKAPLANPTFTGTVGGITKDMVGLGNVDNQSKATLFTSPTFDGTVTMSDSSITHSGPGYFSYNSFIGDMLLIVSSMPYSPASLALAALNPGDQVTITSNGLISLRMLYEAPTPMGNNDYSLRFFDSTGISNGDQLESITMPLKPSISAQELTINGLLTVSRSSEVVNLYDPGTMYEYVYDRGSIWHHANLSGTWTAQFTTMPTANHRVMVMTLIIEQGTTAYLPYNDVTVNGHTTTVKWLGGVVPVGTPSSTDILSYTIIKVSETDVWWSVLGSITSYKAAV